MFILALGCQLHFQIFRVLLESRCFKNRVLPKTSERVYWNQFL